MARSTEDRAAETRRGTETGNASARDDRLAELEARVDVLDEAVRLLAWGLEPHPADEPVADRAARAAARAHELLLSARQ